MTKAIPATELTSASVPPSYLPLRTFMEQMAKSKDDNPYKSVFSFVPFIEKMRTQKKAANSSKGGGIDTSFIDESVSKLATVLNATQLDTPEERHKIISILFPTLFFEGQLGFVGKPFSKEFFFMTPALEEFFTSDLWEVKVQGVLEKGKMGNPALNAGQLILNTFHGQNAVTNGYQTMTFRHRETNLEKHFKMNVVLDFIKTTPLKEIEPLDERALHKLYGEWDNEQYWLERFPPEDYVFEGLVIGYIQDVTEVEVLSHMKEMLIDEANEDDDPELVRKELNRQISSYLDMPDIVFGNLLNRNFKYATLTSWSIMGSLEELAEFSQEDFNNSATYGRVIREEEFVIIGDLSEVQAPTKVELQLLKKGVRSLLLVPQRDSNGKKIGILEIASALPYRVNKQVLDKLSEIISLFNLGANRWIQSLDNRINLFIQKQFTYIHPSVEWKFQEVSQNYLLAPPNEEQPVMLEPIGFKDVYPLYGQADIVGSSKIRNKSIEEDMLDNLRKVQKVMEAFRAQLEFQLLDFFHAKAQAFVKRLEEGNYVSSDESQIVELLTEDIHPLLQDLLIKHSHLPKEVFNTYWEYLDPKLHIVYRKRKQYEESVQVLNEWISTYIDAEVAKKQKVIPNFFEKYVTDGVEYNIYLGQSILSEGTYSDYFLKDFRLWQLILMCEVTRLVESNKEKLQVPLTTAQLIFVYNNALSICFNMDEKQFDVDGAYNVRYEILKKRIDKAVIKGTSERLTQKGKVAIVWLQEKDRAEYMEYLQHLLQQGYITDDIETLELEKLQGADGLKALRVTVAQDM